MGVFLKKENQKYCVQVTFKGRRIWLGSYAKKREAVAIFKATKLKRNLDILAAVASALLQTT